MRRFIPVLALALSFAACGDIKVNPYTTEGRAPRPAKKDAAAAPAESAPAATAPADSHQGH